MLFQKELFKIKFLEITHIDASLLNGLGGFNINLWKCVVNAVVVYVSFPLESRQWPI